MRVREIRKLHPVVIVITAMLCAPIYAQAPPQAQPATGQPLNGAASVTPIARGYIGIGVSDLTPAGIQTFGSKGAMVVQVAPGSPAAQAGMRIGDVITAINGAPISQAADVSPAVQQFAPGSTLQLQMLRGRQPVAINVLVAQGANPATQSGGLTANPPAAPPLPLSPAQDAWTPDSQVGDLQFNVPSGWKQTQVREGIVLAPNVLSAKSTVIIGVLAPQTVGDPKSWFRAAWANLKNQLKMNSD